MLKQGLVKLPDNFFPNIPNDFSEEEQKQMLIISGFDLGQGLSLVQTVPELAKESTCISYSDRNRSLVNLYYPIIKTAIAEEFIHAKIISFLNNAAGEEESPNYKMTFLFIADDNNKNLKLCGIFTGETGEGKWVTDEVKEGIAKYLSVEVYKRNEKINNQEKKDGTNNNK